MMLHSRTVVTANKSPDILSPYLLTHSLPTGQAGGQGRLKELFKKERRREGILVS
jgi:hypothetical protein